ncbi:hypothetical protein [Sulfitobacter sabulilitoris]|uniref:Uncharacterized protein n=1 Tax=Sulfitobacter sabulilitoris TaxID=2562655 RepID=A0A5S3PEP5_9RHOB|nr:hypothetical protein [Sulfitobacter sabulilitoris]TMM52498.1 hypothetical protein FDT80_09465 [Sulfitobacter sabulilitoris]
MIGLCIATSGVAAPAVVRTGEHDSFTRVVVNLPDGATWQMSGEGVTRVVTLTGHSDGFDIGGVFRRIPQTRVSDIRAGRDTITVSLACACGVNSFLIDRMLILDVTDAPVVAQASLQPEPSAPVPGPRQPVITFHYGDLIWDRRLPPKPSVQFPSQPSGSQAHPEKPGVREATGDRLNAVPVLTAPDDAGTRLLRATRDQLIRSVGRATTQGLLSPQTPDLEMDPLPRNDVDLPDLPVLQALAVTPETSGNIRITNSMERTTRTGDGYPDQLTQLGQTCPPPDSLKVEDWAKSTSFNVEISAARQMLFGEFDRLDQDAAVALARLYLHFGFGAEARQTLGLAPDLALLHPMLMDLAEIFELGHSLRQTGVARFTDCPSEIALWAVLAWQAVPDHQMIDGGAALRALTALPLHLRRELAPELSRRFLASGLTHEAAAALRNIERLPEPLKPNATLAKSELEMQAGSMPKAEALLSDVAGKNALQSPQALIQLVDRRLAAGQAISVETTTLVAAYAQELRDGPIAPALRRALVLALAQSDQFTKAFDALRAHTLQDGDQNHDTLTSEVLSQVTRRADDISFLDHVFAQANDRPERLSPDTLLEMSARLVSLGFAAQADPLIAAVPAAPLSPERQVIGARIALAMDQPRRALAALAQMDGPEADALRAEALLLAGDTAQAAAVYQAANDPDAARDAAWLSEGWQDLMDADTPVFGAVATLAQEPANPIDVADGMLSKSSAALENSVAARAALDNLLTSLQIPAADQP